MSEDRTLTIDLSRNLAREYANNQTVIANILKPFARLAAQPKDMIDAKFKIHEIVRRLDVAAVKWSRVAITTAYRTRRAEVKPLVEKVAVLIPIKKLDPAKENVAKLILKTAELLVSTNASIEKTCNTFLKAYETAIGGVSTARQNVQTQSMTTNMEYEMSRKVEYYLARGYDEGSIARKLRQYLSELVDGKNFIEISGRFYELKAYAENMARTELHKAYVEATIDEAKQYEVDLLQFSSHQDPCEICAALEGMVFSISGEDEEYPSIDDTVTVDTAKGPVEVDPKFPHYSCEHNLDPITRNILKANQ
jgi:hypothetical protein